MRANDVLGIALSELIVCSPPRGGRHDYAQGLRNGAAGVIVLLLGYDVYPMAVHERARDAVIRFAEAESAEDRLVVGPLERAKQVRRLRAAVKRATAVAA